MSVLLEIHQVLAFLVALCAVVFSWNPNGRRVVNAVVGLQVLLGLVVAAVMGAQHEAMPAELWIHIVVAFAIMAAYGFAMRLGKRAGGASQALALSVVGLILVLLNIFLGFHMVGMF